MGKWTCKLSIILYLKFSWNLGEVVFFKYKFYYFKQFKKKYQIWSLVAVLPGLTVAGWGCGGAWGSAHLTVNNIWPITHGAKWVLEFKMSQMKKKVKFC